MIAICSYQSSQRFGTSRLFARIVQDATAYFLVIVCVHLVMTIYTSRIIMVVSPPPLVLKPLPDGRFGTQNYQENIFRIFPAM